jgi:hypothetical protein
LDRKLQTYYENRFSTMSTQGWKDFVEDAQSLFDVYNQIDTIGSHEEFLKRKGQLDILKWVLTIKDVSEQAYEELKNEEAV